MNEHKESTKVPKRLIPTFIFVFVSQSIGYMVIFVGAIIYMNQLITLPSDKLYTIGISIFGIAVALSGLCFSMTTHLTEDKKEAPIYAGEKFFHSGLLVIQTVFLKYISDNIQASNIFKNMTWLQGIVTMVLLLTISFTFFYATSFFLYGFKSLNNFLWQRMKERRIALGSDQ